MGGLLAALQELALSVRWRGLLLRAPAPPQQRKRCCAPRPRPPPPSLAPHRSAGGRGGDRLGRGPVDGHSHEQVCAWGLLARPAGPGIPHPGAGAPVGRAGWQGAAGKGRSMVRLGQPALLPLSPPSSLSAREPPSFAHGARPSQAQPDGAGEAAEPAGRAAQARGGAGRRGGCGVAAAPCLVIVPRHRIREALLSTQFRDKGFMVKIADPPPHPARGGRCPAPSVPPSSPYRWSSTLTP